MSHNILITGASGYLGGTLLTRWKEANLPPYNKLYALIRTEEQANAVQTLYNAEPVQIDLRSDVDIEQAIISRDISIIYYLIDPLEDRIPRVMVRALGTVKQRSGRGMFISCLRLERRFLVVILVYRLIEYCWILMRSFMTC